MEFNLNTINKNSVEGKLLLAAIIEMTTRLHTNMTPDEVIKRLWEIHKNTEEANKPKDCCLKSGNPQPFQIALNEQITKERQKQTAKLDEISKSANTVLVYATPSMAPDDYTSLENLLVKLYRHHSNS